MFGPNNASAVATRPASVNTGPSGWFGPGDPGTGVLPTLLDADFLNGLVAEMFAVLAAAGIAPDKATVNQLLLAIRAIAQQVGDARYMPAGSQTDLSGYATRQYVRDQLDALINGAPSNLDTLLELAQAVQNDQSGVAALLAQMATKAAQVNLDATNATVAGKVNRSGDSMQGLTVTSLTSPTVTSPAGQNLPLQAGGVTGAEVDTDGFVRLATPLPRTANDDRAARTDHLRLLLGSFSNSYDVSSGTVTLTLADLGRLIRFLGVASVALPSPSSAGPGSTIWATAFFGIGTLTGIIFDLAAGGIVSSYTVPVGQTVFLTSDGLSWVANARINGGGKLQTLPGYPVTISTVTTSYDFTWTAGAYDRVLLAIQGLINDSDTTNSIRITAYRDGSGSWVNYITQGGLILNAGAGGGPGQDNVLTFQGGNLDQGTAGRHTGGLSGLRMAGVSGQGFHTTGPVNVSGA